MQPLLGALSLPAITTTATKLPYKKPTKTAKKYWNQIRWFSSFARSAAEVPRVARMGADAAEVPAASEGAETTSAASAWDAILLTRRLIRKNFKRRINQISTCGWLSRKRRINQISTFGWKGNLNLSRKRRINQIFSTFGINKNSSNFIENFVKAELEFLKIFAQASNQPDLDLRNEKAI